MSDCLAKIRHEKSNGGCGGGGLQVFAREEDSGVDGYCFSCGEYVRHPYGEEKEADTVDTPHIKTAKEKMEELAEVDGYQCVDLKHRKLREETLAKFGVKVAMSEQDGKTPTAVFYPYTKDGKVTGYKVKTIVGKKMWSIGKLKGVDLFGWEQAVRRASRRLIITEGEEDAVALARAIDMNTKKDFETYKPSVVSLPHGAGSVKSNLPKLVSKINDNFQEVVFCFDNDKIGQEATDKAMLLFPDAHVITLPDGCKDANDCVINGKTKALFNSATFKIEKKKNTRLVYGADLHEAAREQAQWGELSWPWPKLQEATRGIRYGETIYIGAGAKMGKSEVVNTLGAHFIKEHGIRIFMAKPEEANKKSYKLLAGKLAGKIFHDPKVKFDEEAYDEAGKLLQNNTIFVNLYQHMGWGTLQGDITQAVNEGAKAIFVDPITNLTDGMPPSEANVKLQDMCSKMSAMAVDMNFVIFIFCHLKEHSGDLTLDKRQEMYKKGRYINIGNCPYNRGGTVSSSFFAGSRAMAQKCNLMIGMGGNRDDELDEGIRNIRHLTVLEDREFGESLTVPLYWNKNTTLFEEM